MILHAVIMDVDGTMYRQAPVRRAMLWRLLRAHAASPLRGVSTMRMLSAYRRAQEELRDAEFAGLPMPSMQVRLACERTGQNETAMTRCVQRWMEEEPLPLLARARYPYLLEFLAVARARGLRLAALSDYDPRRKLKALGVSGFFDVVASAADPEIQTFKPDPRGLQVVLRKLGVRPHQAIYVGDRIGVDSCAAERASVPCAIIGQPGASAGSFVPASNYMELSAFIARH